MQFDSLELQKNIEEKRLVYGGKFGNFLTKWMARFSQFLRDIGSSKYFDFYSCFAVFLISLLIRSSRDLGYDTGAYLEVGGKILSGGKYYYDFFDFNLPLALYLGTIPHLIAKIFSIHLIIAAEIFYNLIGIIVVIACGLILRRSDLYRRNRGLHNVILLAFAVGYFLRTFTLQFNEFGTKASYILLFAYPYIAYQFLPKSATTNTISHQKSYFLTSSFWSKIYKKNLIYILINKVFLVNFILKNISPKKTIFDGKWYNSDRIISGIFAGLIFCLKPHYFLLVISFEVMTIIGRKSIRCLFCLPNLICLLVIFCYLLLVLKYCPEYFKSDAAFKSIYNVYQLPEFWLKNAFLIFSINIMPALLLAILTFEVIWQNQYVRLLMIAAIGGSLIGIAERGNVCDQLTTIYSLLLPFVAAVSYLLIKQDKINFSHNWFLIFSIIIIAQFDVVGFIQLSIDVVVLWWVVFLLISFSWRRFFNRSFLSKLHFDLMNKKLQRTKEIILLRNNYFKVAFVTFVVVTTVLSTTKLYYQINYLLCLAILSLTILQAEKLHQNFISKSYYSKTKIIVVTIILAKYLSVIIVGMFNHQNLYSYDFSSPSDANSEIIKTINRYTNNQQRPIIISYGVYGLYPILLYADKKNPLPFHSLSSLEDNIADSIKYNSKGNDYHLLLKDQIFYGYSSDEIATKKYLLARLKMAIADKNNQLLIIYKKHYDGYDDCRIGFLEYYFQDDQFRKMFFKNYHFLNRVISGKNINPKDNAALLKHIKDSNIEAMIKDSHNIAVDAEIYTRN